MKRRLKKIVALALTVAMVFSLSMTSVFAYSSDIYSSNAPKETMEVDETELSGATARANTTALSFLGINVTSTDSAGTLNSASDTASPLNLLVFGSDLNENPDPYLWNFYYNLNANGETYPNKLGEGESNTGKPIDEWKDIYKLDDYKSWKGAYTLLNYANSGPTGAAPNTDVIPIQVNSTVTTECNPLFYFEPDVLMGGTEGTYTVGLENYQDTVNSDYDPLELYGWGTSNGQYAMRDETFASTAAMANGVYTMAKDIDAYLRDNRIEKVSRYNDGSVLQCGVDYSSFALGVYYYIQSRLNPINPLIGSIKKAGYCTGISVNEYGGEITITNEESLNYRYTQYLDGLADCAETGKTYSSYGTLKNDVQLIIMDTSKLTQSQLTLIEKVNIKVLDINSVMPNTVYGTTMQSADNILGVPYFVGMLYEGKLSNYGESLSEYDYIAYFVKNLYHVNEEDVASVVEEMVKNGSGDVNHPYSEIGISSYYDSFIGSLIRLGAAYYKESDDYGSGIWQAVDDGTFVIDSES